jgi:hypothetical protein
LGEAVGSGRAVGSGQWAVGSRREEYDMMRPVSSLRACRISSFSFSFSSLPPMPITFETNGSSSPSRRASSRASSFLDGSTAARE